MPKVGVLYIVATPIGNVGDITERARATLEKATLVLVEDTRHSGGLLKRLGIQAELHSYHQHNEEARSAWAIKRLIAGNDIALVSDAGTPLLSDPGFRLVHAAHDQGIRVEPVPGPSSIVAALSVAGLPSDRFFFEGFLPAKSSSRRSRLIELGDFPHTQIYLESPHRILACIKDMVDVFGDARDTVIARELTKIHETVRKDSLAGLLKWLQDDKQQTRGEFVILVGGAEPKQQTQSETDILLKVLLTELGVKQAVTVAARISGEKRNELYRRILELDSQ